MNLKINTFRHFPSPFPPSTESLPIKIIFIFQLSNFPLQLSQKVNFTPLLKILMHINTQLQRPNDYKQLVSPSFSDNNLVTKSIMCHMSYNRVGRRYNPTRGFRINTKRLYVQRLRTKFFNFFKMLIRSWRSSSSSYEKSTTKDCVKTRQRTLVAKENAYRLKSFGRSNSFYSEAIEDCLEFIKRSSVSLDDKP